MKVQIISLFPEMFGPVMDNGMMRKAQEQDILDISYINLRDFGLGPRKTVDDTPYGGGDGMVLMVEPLTEAIEFAKNKDKQAKVLLMTPSGKPWKQQLAEQYSQESGLILICGRYEGYDERIVDLVDQKISVGDYVLTGGEIPAMAIVDSVVRLIPGVLGGETSAAKESFSDGRTLEHPHYTRPEEFRGKQVPKVLLSGNHAEIEKWRQENSSESK
jgi:tRNA (guanine37-N1)-methyltransferase